MAIHVSLFHKTQYTYDRLVGHGPHVVRLRPAPHCRTRILSYSQKITGGEHFINWQQDPFSNWNARLVFPDLLRELSVEIELVAEMAVYNPFDFFVDDAATFYPFEYEAGLKKDLGPFLDPCPLTPRFAAVLATIKTNILGHPESVPHPSVPESGHRLDVHEGGHIPVSGEPAVTALSDAVSPKASEANPPLRTIDFLVALNQKLQRDIKYLIRLETGVQSPEETLTKGSGSCRDSSWLLAHLLRHFGLAARFVSGYLIQLTPDVKALDGPSGTENDFTDLHAWCEVFLPGAGWIGLDPTSGLLAGEGHIPLSCTPEPSAAAPVSGAVDPCEATLHHEMRIRRVYESPRVTKPYTEEQWGRIGSLGHAIDADLVRRDVRLTMGGEPTFVSIDDPDGEEWNFTAVSRPKRELSGELIRRLRQRFAPGAMLHYGQGKWYPGEPLPRWSLAAFWRKDGVPIWGDESLIADESKDYGFGAPEAKALSLRIAEVLGGDPRWLLPGYEDAFYYIWKERRLPSNVTPANSQLKDPLERERIARLFQKGLGEVVGYALPLKRDSVGGQPGWTSGPWFLRDDDMLWLTPGDSPMGLRLPIDSIPWVTDKEYPWVIPRDSMEPLGPLPKSFPRQAYIPSVDAAAALDRVRRREMQATQGGDFGAGVAKRLGLQDAALEFADNPSRKPLPGQSASWVVRTAICVEPRHGRLHVFLPPVEDTEDYLELISGIETAVAELKMPVILEGDPPPRDPRLNKLAVTPDPGVIEVNLHPSSTWDELVERTTVLYEEARQTRLGTEKFLLDGRHTGTGGGNHIIVGGATPSDSPLLRRPDLLRSLLAYWQNHPSLSWLFSGLFIGPTSQAPRLDEARNDSLHELELAFDQMERRMGVRPNALARGASAPVLSPWLVDRLFRNLLMDASGNTHRSEFSIDKLYSPDGPGGRLGLLEMRAFEMPPHARMSLAQHLLLRGALQQNLWVIWSGIGCKSMTFGIGFWLVG